MLVLRHVKALGAAAVVAGSLAAAAPAVVFADSAAGCNGTYSLTAGQTASCTFVTTHATTLLVAGGLSGSAGSAAGFRVELASTGAPLAACALVSPDGGASGCLTSGWVTVPAGTVVNCVAEGLSAAVAVGPYFCQE